MPLALDEVCLCPLRQTIFYLQVIHCNTELTQNSNAFDQPAGCVLWRKYSPAEAHPSEFGVKFEYVLVRVFCQPPDVLPSKLPLLSRGNFHAP